MLYINYISTKLEKYIPASLLRQPSSKMFFISG